jgi:hypothetical protein
VRLKDGLFKDEVTGRPVSAQPQKAYYSERNTQAAQSAGPDSLPMVERSGFLSFNTELLRGHSNLCVSSCSGHANRAQRVVLWPSHSEGTGNPPALSPTVLPTPEPRSPCLSNLTVKFGSPAFQLPSPIAPTGSTSCPFQGCAHVEGGRYPAM